MNITRRALLIGSGLVAVARRGHAQMAHMPPMALAPHLVDPGKLAPFVDPLPIPAIAVASGKRPSPAKKSHVVPYYRIPMQQAYLPIHRDVPPTRFWTYGGSMPGSTIEARSGEEILIEWPNQLPSKHFLPIDHNIMGAESGQPEVRTVVHVHGAKVPPASDGYPTDWYVPGKSGTYRYPNEQEAAMLWYHDHAMGINRLNICAGLAGLYIVRDSVEDSLNLPKGAFEIPLVLMDRMIRQDGQIYYPVSQVPDAPWVAEYFGNCILVNGKLLPYVDVQARKYRFRILNASNARFYSLLLSNGQVFQQIGSDQGLLAGPAALKRLSIAPGERADIVLDFSEHAGEQIVLTDLAVPVMQFRVSKERVTDTSFLPATLRPVPRIPESAAIQTRRLTLEEYDNILAEPITHLLDGKRWHEPISERPVLGSTEIWEFLNLTDDSHPIHLHLVRFQLLDRRLINVDSYIFDKELRYDGEAVPPDPGEAGWKDTIRVAPGTSTRIIVKFEGYAGRYVWHCHILEHEDNEMMRPYEVVAGDASLR